MVGARSDSFELEAAEAESQGLELAREPATVAAGCEMDSQPNSGELIEFAVKLL